MKKKDEIYPEVDTTSISGFAPVKLTSKKISIAFNSVTSVSGQQIPFRATELSGKFEDILQSNNYIGELEKSITVNF